MSTFVSEESGAAIRAPRSTPVDVGYQFLMLFLCLYAILALVAGAVLPISEQTYRILQYADMLVCVVFFGDFLASLRRAPDRLRYFRTWGWIDLISSIPMLDPFRLGRLARIFRIIRILRALRATKIVAHYWLARRKRSTLYSLVIVVFSLITFSSVAVLNVEAGADGNIGTAEDALWWAVATITTVGYGDFYPVTSEGRAVAVVLMTAGVGIFGTLSGVIASSFLKLRSDEAGDEIADLRAAVAELKDVVEALKEARK